MNLDFRCSIRRAAANERGEPEMNTCWKCGKELPEGQTGECEYGCAAAPSFPTDAQIKEAFRRINERRAQMVELDFDKIQTLQDALFVFRIVFEGIKFFHDGPQAKALAKFLKEKK